MRAYQVLVVEDDAEIRKGIGIYLKNQGYEVLEAADGIEGLEMMAGHDIHLAIVDIMMPRMDGIEMTMRLREQYDFPVIMLSAKSEDMDKVSGLNIGADDYVTKPFNPMELLARVNSQLRRYEKMLSIHQSSQPQQEIEEIYRCGGIEVNVQQASVMVDGESVKLTPTEYKILLLLIRNPGRVYSSDEIYEKIWNERAVNTDTIMVHIRKLREKIEINPKQPKYIKVVWGIGYKMEKQ